MEIEVFYKFKDIKYFFVNLLCKKGKFPGTVYYKHIYNFL